MEYKTKAQKRSFYKSNVWRGKNGLRNRILKRDNYECATCKREGRVTTKDIATLEIDHIKELETHPALAEEESNLQILCRKHHNDKHNRFFGTERIDKWQDEMW